jgi:hypothetical protein
MTHAHERDEVCIDAADQLALDLGVDKKRRVNLAMLRDGLVDDGRRIGVIRLFLPSARDDAGTHANELGLVGHCGCVCALQGRVQCAERVRPRRLI